MSITEITLSLGFVLGVSLEIFPHQGLAIGRDLQLSPSTSIDNACCDWCFFIVIVIVIEFQGLEPESRKILVTMLLLV